MFKGRLEDLVKIDLNLEGLLQWFIGENGNSFVQACGFREESAIWEKRL